MELWWQVALHDTWAFTMVFIRGDERPARFLPEAAPRLRLLSDPAKRARLAALIAGRLER